MGRSCKWAGTIGTLPDHLQECKFALIPCSKQCKTERGEIARFMRKDLDQHLARDCPNRNSTCPHCRRTGPLAAMQEHDKTCKKKIMPCTNPGCRKTLQRQHLQKHVSLECQFTVVTCKHKAIGCGRALKRKDMAGHEQDDSYHLHMAIETISLMKRYIDKTTSMTFQLTEYRNKRENNEEFISPSFYTVSGHHIAIRVYANGNGTSKGTHVSVFVFFQEGKYDAHLKWPFVGKVTITLLNQTDDNNHYEKIIDILERDRLKPTISNHLRCSQYISHSELEGKPYLKDDTLYFRVSLGVAGHKPWLECNT